MGPRERAFSFGYVFDAREMLSELPAPDVDPLQAIHQRRAADLETLENRTLVRITRAIQERRGDFDDADIWALGARVARCAD